MGNIFHLLLLMTVQVHPKSQAQGLCCQPPTQQSPTVINDLHMPEIDLNQSQGPVNPHAHAPSCMVTQGVIFSLDIHLSMS